MKKSLVAWAAVFLLAISIAAQEHNHVQIARENMPAVVAVNVLKKDGSTFTATGFVLTENGLVATNRHALDDALYINLTFNTGTVSGEAVPLTKDPTVDLALLQIQAQHLPHVILGNSNTVQPGQTITVIGNPRRLQNTVTSGIVSQIRLQKDGTLWHQISAPISPSSSGSPVFNAQSEVIAIAFASLNAPENQNLNFAIPVNYLKELLQQQGIDLPGEKIATPPANTHNPFVCHVQKSWQILKRLVHRWFNGTPTQESYENKNS